jgi:hypothetical protein
LFAFCGLAGVASAAPKLLTTYPTAACPVHGHVEPDVSYSCSAEFTLQGTNGYRITVSADAEPRTDPEVKLSAVGPAGNVEYTVPGKVTGATIRAKFGDLGRVSVRFHPSGRERDVAVPKRCQKDRPAVVTSRLGRFVGTIKFRGEGGFTQVGARSAQGGTGDPLTNTPQKLRCEFHISEAERQRELESVALDASPGTGITFGAARLFAELPSLSDSHGPLPPKGDRYLFLALASEKVGPMSVLRSAGAIGESTNFLFDPALTSATVSPPAPFTGSGDFLRGPDGSVSWTGSLAVPLPGLGTVGLTGGKATLETVASGLARLEEELQAGRHS